MIKKLVLTILVIIIFIIGYLLGADMISESLSVPILVIVSSSITMITKDI